jgi:hypothetical protein
LALDEELAMSLNDLLPELLKLNREEMAEAIKILQQQVVSEPTAQIQSGSYEVWSPTITLEAAAILQDVLKEANERDG